MTTTPGNEAPHDDAPPDVRLVCRAGIAILGRIIDNGRVTDDDIRRLRAYRRALYRLGQHIDAKRADP